VGCRHRNAERLSGAHESNGSAGRTAPDYDGFWAESPKATLAQTDEFLPDYSNVDNGPENQSRRTQCMHRMVEFVQQYHVTVRLAYYPPYHSKYNPMERCWGILENHWHGSLLDAIDAVLQFAATMTWKGTHPIVTLVTTTYETGVTLTKEAMEAVEAKIKRLPLWGKWCVDIVPAPLPRWDP
jgi:Rhodopirellula transposase DDE domain